MADVQYKDHHPLVYEPAADTVVAQPILPIFAEFRA
jgi:hypothetical protein